MCPPLYGRFKNGLVYGFIKGNVSTVEQLGQERTAEWIAKKLGQWHLVNLPEDINNGQIVKHNIRKQKLWKTMKNWLEQVPRQYENPEIQAIFQKRFDMNKIRTEV